MDGPRVRAGLGAGTQVLTQGFGQAAFGTGELSTALSISAGWVVNVAVAELVIHRANTRRPAAPRRRVPAGLASGAVR